MLFVKQQSGIVARDRQAANVIGNNFDAAAVKLNQPAGRRRSPSNSRWLNGMGSDEITGVVISAGAGSLTGGLRNIKVLQIQV
jgi:hypothetical protein